MREKDINNIPYYLTENNRENVPKNERQNDRGNIREKEKQNIRERDRQNERQIDQQIQRQIEYQSENKQLTEELNHIVESFSINTKTNKITILKNDSNYFLDSLFKDLNQIASGKVTSPVSEIKLNILN
jgi:hypothetical protein